MIFLAVQQSFAPARVAGIHFSGREMAQVFVLTNDLAVFVNPYDGTILGKRDSETSVRNAVHFMHQLHISLAAGSFGGWVVDLATLELLLLAITGLSLWWKNKRLGVSRKSTWTRFTWDLHNTIGAYTFLFLLIVAATGLLAASLQPSVGKYAAQQFTKPPLSVAPSPGQDSPAKESGSSPRSEAAVASAGIEQVLQTAEQALPGLQTDWIWLPLKPTDPYAVIKPVPEWQVGTAKSRVFLDQYSGQVLRIDDVRQFATAYHAYYVSRSIHTGSILGLPTQSLMSLSGLLLVVSAVTGGVLGSKRLRTVLTKRKSSRRIHIKLDPERMSRWTREVGDYFIKVNRPTSARGRFGLRICALTLFDSCLTILNIT
jgi:uncharacterized iron-regulated membrane protein